MAVGSVIGVGRMLSKEDAYGELERSEGMSGFDAGRPKALGESTGRKLPRGVSLPLPNTPKVGVFEPELNQNRRRPPVVVNN